MNNADDLKLHVSAMHNLACKDCWKVFSSTNELSAHFGNCQSDRKRTRMEASLLLDVCDQCEDNFAQKNELKEHLEATKLSLENAKENNCNLKQTCSENKTEIDQKSAEVMSLKKDINTVTKARDELKTENELRNLENLELKNDIKVLRREIDSNDPNGLITEKNEEIERGKLIIQERDKTIKKLKENQKKEVQELQREKPLLKRI